MTVSGRIRSRVEHNGRILPRCRVVIADRSRLSWLALRRRFNNLRARLRFIRWPGCSLVGPADRFVIAPQELRTADPTRAAEIYAGRFAFAGKVVICDGRSPVRDGGALG